MKLENIITAFLALALSLSVMAQTSPVQEPLVFENQAQQDRFDQLTKELRCLVCQNQNLADSNAELAVDLRRKTYQMVQQGKSEKEIADYMVDRYGEFVLYRPPLNTNTLLLWGGPFIILLIGVALLIRTILQRRSQQTVDVDDDHLKAAARLLDTDRDKRKA